LRKILVPSLFAVAVACGIYAAVTLSAGDDSVDAAIAAPTPTADPTGRELAAAPLEPIPAVPAPEEPEEESSSPAAAAPAPTPSDERSSPPRPRSQLTPRVEPSAPVTPRPERVAAPGPRLDHRSPLERRYDKMAERWSTESRDSAWANEKERRILDHFRSGNLERMVANLDCRSTVCNIQIRLRNGEDFIKLMHLPGLESEIGPEVVTQPDGPPGDRRIFSYFAREGHTIPELVGE
jgi:hypothetical protein